MKSNFLRKAKWYVIGFILVAIMLSVSLSFCSWDKMSLQAKVSQGNSGNFRLYNIIKDNNNNQVADVGDIVSYGNYYQQANLQVKEPINWIVVHSENNELTLLAEKVLAFGSFWGNWYHNGTEYIWSTQKNGIYYQNYSMSTLRAWLNSYYTLRNDGGTPFSENSLQPKFHGFMNEAFSEKEVQNIKTKTMSSMRGYGIDGRNPETPTDEYESISDKVWVLSWAEIFGKSLNIYDGTPNVQFSYFKGAISDINNEILKGNTTTFASTPKYSNYTVENTDSIFNAQNVPEGGNVWWWLRSPNNVEYSQVYAIEKGGVGSSIFTDQSRGGVRPSIIIPA